MINHNLAKILREMSVLLEIKGENFKPQAYEKAAHSVEILEQDAREIYKDGGVKALEDIPGVGKGIAERIEEYLKTHHIKDYDKLKKELPVKIDELSAVEGLGKKTEENILRSIGFLKKEHGRFVLGFIMPQVRAIVDKIEKVNGVEKAEFAGSIRRMQETVGDLDILVISKKPSEVMDFFVSMPEVEAKKSITSDGF